MLNVDGADTDPGGGGGGHLSSDKTKAVKPVGDTFPLLDEMLLETPAFSLYYRQQCVERFCGADLDRLERQLDRLRAMYVVRKRLSMQELWGVRACV